MTMVVKIGGALLQNPAKAVAALRELIKGPAAVVHGGGIQITKMLERMNAQSTFVEGLRVTDAAALCAVSLALMGEVHVQLVQSMRAGGMPVVGVFGAIMAEQKSGPWGFVGTNVSADSETFKALLERGKIPVIPTLAMNSETLLNVNSDETASALAVDLKADELIFMTDVAGVLNESGDVIGRVHDVNELLSSKFVSGGMLPKLRAVKFALTGGVRRVRVGQTVFTPPSEGGVDATVK